jgi:hypothetical protein
MVFLHSVCMSHLSPRCSVTICVPCNAYFYKRHVVCKKP